MISTPIDVGPIHHAENEKSDSVITVRSLGHNDGELCSRLTVEAGWNQTEADWRRFRQLQPDGCFVAELNGQSAGTVTTCVLDQVGWIAMLLVDKASRRRGVGRALLNRAIDFLESRRISTIRLDATSMGESLYKSTGFASQFDVTRFYGIAHANGFGKLPQSPREADWEQIVLLDQRVVGYDRSRLLLKLAEEAKCLVSIASGSHAAQGFLITRPGRLAVQIGPCVAMTTVVGQRLLAHACKEFSGKPVFLDIPSDNHEAVATAAAAGLQPVRQFVRMVRGAPILERICCLWTSSGPENG
jgi:GNAT superfamily N-acetyltransferase